MAENKPESLIPLSAEAFIEALQGKQVLDENGIPRHFFYKKYKLPYTTQASEDVVVIENILIKESIEIIDKESPKESLQSKEGAETEAKKIIFEHPIVILSSTFQSYFSINGGIFKSNFSIKGGDFQFGCWIDNGVFEGDFLIFDGLFQGSFWIDGGIFQSRFGVYYGIFESAFKVSNGIFKHHFGVYDGVFQDDFSIDGGVFQNGFSIEGGMFESYFSIDGGAFEADFEIYGGVFRDIFSIDDGVFESSFMIKGGSFEPGVWIDGGEFKKVSLIPNYLAKLNYSAPISSDILIDLKETSKNFFIQEIELDGIIHPTGNLHLRNAQVKNLIFKELENRGEMLFFNVQEFPSWDASYLKIQRSDLGNASFRNVNFENFSKIIIDASKVSNISTFVGHFPQKEIYSKERNYIPHINLANENWYECAIQNSVELADTYTQLQAAMQKQGNRKQELGYHACSLKWQRESILASSFFERDWANLISLSLYQWSTNYGQSWLQGLGVYFALAMGLYFLYIVCLPEMLIDQAHLNLKNINFHFQNFFNFLIPIRKFEFMSKNPGWASILIDFISRVSLSYMIYQIIMAFRRYGQK